jgi:hypothetical protein
VIKKRHLTNFDLCLELACGGALQLSRHILINIFKQVDINEISPR